PSHSNHRNCAYVSSAAALRAGITFSHFVQCPPQGGYVRGTPKQPIFSRIIYFRISGMITIMLPGTTHKFFQTPRFALLCCTSLLLPGCADFTSGPAPLDRTVDANLVQAHTRAGKVFCGRGWLGIFST